MSSAARPTSRTRARSSVARRPAAPSLRDERSTDGSDQQRAVPAFVLGEELADLADHDDRIAVLTADLAKANRTNDFAARHPDRFFNLGIAEKNMISVAAGLASCGLRHLRRDVRLVLGAARLRADPHRLRLPAPAGAGDRPPRRDVDGVLRHEPPQPRGPRHHAHDRRPDRRVRGRRQPPPRHPPRVGRPSRRDVHPPRARSRPRGLLRGARRPVRAGRAPPRRRRRGDHRHRLRGAARRLRAAERLAAERHRGRGVRHAHGEAARRRGGGRRGRDTAASSRSRSTTAPTGSARPSPRRSWRAGSQASASTDSTFPTSTCRSALRPRCTPTTSSTPTGSRPSSGASSTTARDRSGRTAARPIQGADGVGAGSTRSVPVCPACRCPSMSHHI